LPLGEYFRIARQRGWIVVLTAVLGAVSALLFSLTQEPVYQSTIRLNAVGARPDMGLSQTVKSLLRNYAGQIRSYDAAVDALRDMPEPLDLTPEALLAKINVQAVESDLQLVIEAEDPDPIIANMIAQQMAETFIWRIDAYNDTLDQRDRVNVFASGPATPAVKVRPQKKINTLAGGILGGVAGLALVVMLEWMDSRYVRRPQDLLADTGLPLLGVVSTEGTDSRGLAERALGPTAALWAVPLLGGIALGVLVTSLVYLVF
jgi:capsular polysaccharide biosynthesis protein